MNFPKYWSWQIRMETPDSWSQAWRSAALHCFMREAWVKAVPVTQARGSGDVENVVAEDRKRIAFFRI